MTARRRRDKAHGTALITGASSGIGEALAKRFAREGHPLVLTARDAARLEVLAGALEGEFGVAVRIEACDLAQRGAAATLAAALRRRHVAIDVLVNNAGVLQQGEFASMLPERHQELIDLNVSALTAMLAHFVPPMRERGHGRVLNVASIAAFQPVPLLATYAATKAFVLSITESLADELRTSGISVTALCPGITDTRMLGRAVEANGRLAGLPGFLIGDADDVAAEGYRACMEGRVIAVPGALNQAMTIASRATPRWLLRQVTGVLTRRTG
jgi:short-subunit dehydrogenase